MIPKIIFTIWLSEKGYIPEIIKRCIDSQRIPGYEHRLYNLDNCFKDAEYVRQALNSPYKYKKWAKLSDYLRVHYLIKHGGIYLDTDVEVLPGKNFDHLLDNEMILSNEIEPGRWLASSVVGSIPDHPFVKNWMLDVVSRFRGDDNKNCESSVEILTSNYYRDSKQYPRIKVCPREYFQPYAHSYATVAVTKETITYHYFMKSWCGNDSEKQDVKSTPPVEVKKDVSPVEVKKVNKAPDVEFLKKMYALPQDTHPERLYVTSKIGVDNKNLLIYDLGCGRNKTVKEAIGVDVVPFADITSSIDCLPFIKDNSVDVIISRHSFEHILDSVKTLREWYRILRSDGKIIMVLPDFECLDTMDVSLSAGQHLHAFTRDSLRNLISLIPGFELEEIGVVVDGWSFGCIIRKRLGVNPLYLLREKIERNENFSFIKLGDGELLAMLGAPGANCDGQEYGPVLSEALKSAYRDIGRVPNVQITKWKLGMDGEREFFERELGIKCEADHDLLLNRENELSLYHYNFWKSIKESKRKKFFIGPERLSGVVGFLNIDQFIVIPQRNSFVFTPNIEVGKNNIYLFSAGPAGKVWIADLLRKYRDITCIDCGSSFDPIFVGQTRTNQVSQEVLRKFYKGLL